MDGYVVEKYFFILVLINILLLAYASYILNQYVYNWYILGIVIAVFVNLLTISNHFELSTFTFIIIYGLVSITPDIKPSSTAVKSDAKITFFALEIASAK